MTTSWAKASEPDQPLLPDYEVTVKLADYPPLTAEQLAIWVDLGWLKPSSDSEITGETLAAGHGGCHYEYANCGYFWILVCCPGAGVMKCPCMDAASERTQ